MSGWADRGWWAVSLQWRPTKLDADSMARAGLTCSRCGDGLLEYYFFLLSILSSFLSLLLSKESLPLSIYNAERRRFVQNCRLFPFQQK